MHPWSPVLQTATVINRSSHNHSHSSKSPYSHHYSLPPVAGQEQPPSSAAWVPVFALPGAVETHVPVEQCQSEQQQQFMQKSSGFATSVPKPTHDVTTHATISSSHTVSPAADKAEVDELYHQHPERVWSSVEPTAERGEVSSPSSVPVTGPQVHVTTETRRKNEIVNEW